MAAYFPEVLYRNMHCVFFADITLFHVGEAFNCLRKFLNGDVGVSVLDAIAHAMLNMPFQHHLPHAVQG